MDTAAHVLSTILSRSVPLVLCPDIDTFLAQAPKFELAASNKSDSACDMEEFAHFIWLLLEELSSQKPNELQRCVSIVLRNSSGVGKTIATFALTMALRKLSKLTHFPIAIYMGFNSGVPLTDAEESRIKEGDIERVLLRRLLLQLTYLLSTDVVLDDSLWDCKTCLQKMPEPTEGWPSCKSYFSNQIEPHEIRAKVVSTLAKISAKVGAPVALFPIIDEGQFLDEMCPTNHDGVVQGARKALRMFRMLQLDVSKAGGNLLLGIMTGIDPAVALSDSTDGKNTSFEKELHDFRGFMEISNQLLGNVGQYNDLQREMLAATLFPYPRRSGFRRRPSVNDPLV